ncbi:MAG TPA: DUF4304 domain-containing protein [Acidimicrobiales bacterium]|nr:DUF4304 domain-containing protein [Acidimicrobiales bacterium]
MTKPSAAVSAWEARVEGIRSHCTNTNEFADLLQSVDPRWYGALRVNNGVHQIWMMPPGDSLNKGSSLWIKRSTSGFSMEIKYNPGMTLARTVAKRRATLDKAPAALTSLLEELFEGREVPSASGQEDSWAAMLASFRAYGLAEAAKAQLLSPLASKWAGPCEIYDNGKDFGIIRSGDTADDGKALWIRPTNEGWLLRLASQSRHEGSQVIREVEASQEDVLRLLDELLAEMTVGDGDGVVTDVTAQQAYRALLRDFVGPWLRRRGYKGSSGHYGRSVGDYQVAIGFQKSKWSTKERVDYRLNLFVQHPETAHLYNQANLEARDLGREWEAAPAGSWFSTFPGNLGPGGHHWVSLRPGDDLSSHADQLLADLDRIVFPEIERQLELPLSTPTPPSERAMMPSREERNRSALSSTLQALRAAGVDVDVPEHFDI